ncbi:uncharacterized protein TRAVEDRAFT_43071 [Trametes versicolor FP-101664 SS1]|uniref:uncharacterized protein n=1 Tax=Trametes versicolor (strain FP-101664) TaxID=717944 RepID=UPI00046227D0|nr:uncharacterized protein TRAVEDRAFT_43071 [Trametes versicolor FP-101664 SS1]EIW62734.1 hypothetical protein TRAVEDRAFT_43071 [Trametes versicolor FP-101664 SS1]
MAYRFWVSAKSAVHLRNRKKVTLLRENDAFVYRKRGKTVDDHKGLYQAEIIQQMANRVYFKKRTDDGILLRAQYSPFPVPALALILTAVECAIDEWTDGSWTKVSFTEEAYRAAYEHHLEELNMFETTSGDLKVVSQICKRIYDDGRVYAKAGQDESASARQLDPRAVARAIHQFQLSDDEMSEGDPEED